MPEIQFHADANNSSSKTRSTGDGKAGKGEYEGLMSRPCSCETVTWLPAAGQSQVEYNHVTVELPSPPSWEASIL